MQALNAASVIFIWLRLASSGGTEQWAIVRRVASTDNLTDEHILTVYYKKVGLLGWFVSTLNV